MQVVTAIELDSILSSVWLANAEHEALAKYLLSTALNTPSHNWIDTHRLFICPGLRAFIYAVGM